MFKSKKDKSDVTTGIKPVEVGISYRKRIEIAVDSMLESGEIKFDVGALYYLVAINSESLIILKSDDNPFIKVIGESNNINANTSDNLPELNKANIMKMVEFGNDSETLDYIKESLVNQDNFFITLADGVEMFVRYNDVYSFSIKRIYSYEQLRKIIKAREDELEIGGWTDELAEHIEQWFLCFTYSIVERR